LAGFTVLLLPFIQEDKISLNGLFYHGLKESEITCVRELLKDDLLAKQCIIFDALHTQYETLTTIEASLGTYVAQVKENQKELLEDLKDVEFNNKWKPCNLATLIVVDRETTKLKTGRTTTEKSFYVSNKAKSQINTNDFFKAIRNHWQIESDNYLRDTTFRELQNMKIPNIKAKLEDIDCNPALADKLFQKIKFL